MNAISFAMSDIQMAIQFIGAFTFGNHVMQNGEMRALFDRPDFEWGPGDDGRPKIALE